MRILTRLYVSAFFLFLTLSAVHAQTIHRMMGAPIDDIEISRMAALNLNGTAKSGEVIYIEQAMPMVMAIRLLAPVTLTVRKKQITIPDTVWLYMSKTKHGARYCHAGTNDMVIAKRSEHCFQDKDGNGSLELYELLKQADSKGKKQDRIAINPTTYERGLAPLISLGPSKRSLTISKVSAEQLSITRYTSFFNLGQFITSNIGIAGTGAKEFDFNAPHKGQVLEFDGLEIEIIAISDNAISYNITGMFKSWLKVEPTDSASLGEITFRD